ncbi:MAG: hypothetical protein JSS83_03875 [Cyanobacteria bacterium SZAS LIN-3]|nr:hypothetical protein [Cyanobacteria bacterium SZAS LIN-3]
MFHGIKSRRAASTLITTALCSLALMPAVHAAEKAYLQTTSSGFLVKWTAQDLSAAGAASPAATIFSARAKAKAEKPKKKDKTTVDRSFKLLSVVGPLLSYQDESSLDWPGMVHPGVGDVRLYHAIDLRKPTKRALLTDYFQADDVYKAMITCAPVKKFLKAAHSQPKNLAQLMAALQNGDVDMKNAAGDDAKLLFNSDMLSQFCINKVSDKAADVSISLYDQANNEIYPMRMTIATKDANFSAWLIAAAARKEGILADKMTALAPDAETDFHFDP